METTQEYQQLAVFVSEVKKRLERVREDVGNVHLVFLNRYEEVDYVSTIDDNSETEDFDSHMELGMLAGRPYWEICTVKPAKNEIFIDCDWHATEDVTDDLLSEAVEGAVAERIRFYTEREESYGTTAWPMCHAAAHPPRNTPWKF